MSEPTYEDMARAKRLCRYLLGTLSLRLTLKEFSQTNNELEVFVDADFGGDKESRRSVSNCVIKMHGNPVMTYARQQTVVATSSREAECYALASRLAEAL